MKFNNREIKDLVKAWLAVSLAFTIASVGFGSLFSLELGVLMIFLIFMITAGLGFLLHEIMHKYFATKYKANAQFYSNDKMLLVMLLISAFGFIFAAPGAVFISGHISPDKHGKVALAGPMTNVVLALLFLGLKWASPSTFFGVMGDLGAFINGLLAVFNMLPFGMFDGYKVLAWNRFVWLGAGLLSLGVLLLRYVPLA